ncbi:MULTISPECIES: hypothetical protein [Sphingosinicellaceae]|uniref:hypothetical protein n=1 Tax=Sphingosinicellaceae TaxID=2820280 RepID=UPI001C1E5907|nr:MULTISPECIES: hypothetical protein [Polymorphobacter]QYE33466.1 hypothetical protein KZX46_01415 [Polymorphobacter sp. PAMC 29334]UAJ12830.1 hypothetical protein KTC28_20070 [Polymorphobacter megasporae]
MQRNTHEGVLRLMPLTPAVCAFGRRPDSGALEWHRQLVIVGAKYARIWAAILRLLPDHDPPAYVSDRHDPARHDLISNSAGSFFGAYPHLSFRARDGATLMLDRSHLSFWIRAIIMLQD